MIMTTLALSLAMVNAGDIDIERCVFDPPRLPEQSDVALDATLLVNTDAGSGSAVVISPDGFALTAAHVVDASRTVEVVSQAGAVLQAEVVRTRPEQDVALLKVDVSTQISCLPMQDERARPGTSVFVLGSPGGEQLSFSISAGIVSARRAVAGQELLQLDAAANPGNSGGPAVSAQGSIIGIMSWKISDVSMEGLAFAVPADVAIDVLAINFAETSADDWAQHVDPPPPTASATSHQAAPPSPTFDAGAIRRSRIRRGLIGSGVPLAAIGVSVIAISAAVHAGRESPTRGQWSTARGFNTTGWVVAFAGAGLLTAGLLVRKRPRDRESASSIRIRPGIAHAVLEGRF